VVEAVEDDGDRPPTDDELREADIDPEKDRCRSKGEGALPDALE
jgi:hypothetical protein